MNIDFKNFPELITDATEFSRLREECEKVIDTHKRLPDFVFKRHFAKYYAIEYAHAYGRFGELLRVVSQAFGDESVNFMVLDPSPGEQYFRHSSFFGMVSFAATILPSRYSDVLSPIKPPTILAGTNLGVFWGSSLGWGIFADRFSWELAVIAADKEIDVSSAIEWPCFNAEQVRNYMTCQYHAKDSSDSIAHDFNAKFFANYSI